MDHCLAAWPDHGFLSCRKGKQPFLDFCVKGVPVFPHPVRRVGSSFSSHSKQLCKALNKDYGASSFSLALRIDSTLSFSRILASRHVNTNPSSIRPLEDQVSLPSSSNAGFNSTNCIGRNINSNGSDITTMPQPETSINSTNDSRSEISTGMEESSKIAGISVEESSKIAIAGIQESSIVSTAKKSDNGLAGSQTDELCADNIRSSPVRSSDYSGLRKADDNNGNASLPESFKDEILSSGPLLEIHNHVSGKSGSPSTDDSRSSLSNLLASRNIIEFISRFPSWADAQKESGMPQRQKRAFYSHEDWLRHRSSLRYVRHVLSSVSSRVIVSLVPPVFTFTAGAIGVAAYNTALSFGYFPSFLPLLHAASLPYELTAPALALLLVFRTDASYSRYDEARKTWTSVISTTKDLARLSAQLIKSPHDAALKSSLLSYIMAFPVSLKCHLIHGSDTPSDLQRLLQDDDLAFVLSSEHRPNCLIQLISQSLDLVHLDNAERVLLEENLRQYVASVSACERLIRTPIPLSYTRLTSRFLVLWHISLPIVLWDACNWLVVPATFFSAATLFCIEEVGVLIEEPFPMLALDKIIGVAHANIHELQQRQQKTDEFLSLKRKSAKG